MFKIVQTIEKGKKQLTVIPYSWEKNGLLFWPKTKADKLVKLPNSKPETNWFEIRCILKRNHIPSYEIGETILNDMLTQTDTEVDENQETPASSNESSPTSFPRKRVRTILPKRRLENNNAGAGPFIDLNALAELSNNVNFDLANIISTTNQSSPHPSRSDSDVPSTYTGSLLPPSASGSYVLSDNEVTTQPQQQSDPEALNEVLTILGTVVENQHKIFQQMAKFQAVLDEFVVLDRNLCPKCTVSSQDKLDSAPDLSPIQNKEELDAFEEKIKDKDIFDKYLEQLSYICGKDSKYKGLDAAYLLIDRFFAREFFLVCSWAGGARENKEKIPFKFYRNVIDLFYKLVRRADQKFSYVECEIFFKNIIRNALNRSTSTKIRTSKSKNRPSNLIYKRNVAPHQTPPLEETEEVLIFKEDEPYNDIQNEEVI